MGKRLKELTKNNTKCMVKVNGISLIDRMLHQIEALRLSRIIIVVGYEGQKLIDYISTLSISTPIEFIENPIYDKTNNIYSLSLAKERLRSDDTLLFESDLIFEDSVLQELVSDPRDTLALVDKYESWMDGTCVKLGQDDRIEAFVPGKRFVFDEKDEYFKTVNIYKFSKHFSETHYVPFLEAYQCALGQNEYYEQVLRVIALLDDPGISAKRLNGQLWYEIDDIQDLDIAESMFSPDDDEKIALLQGRYGGYWRYPKLIDFCYLVNPYFPSERMKNFEEYPNRYSPAEQVIFTPGNQDFSYTADDIMKYFEGRNINNLVVINPDNPSGNYIPKKDMLRLIKWCGEQGIKAVIDESFVDFADEEDSTIIDQEILNANSNLYVMKSISKSYGVPGLRLGVLASGDVKTIASMKKDVAIWNINSFAEFYMQISEKYKKDYAEALIKLRAERARFESELAKIPGLRVIPSQANFVMVETSDSISPKGLLKTLMINHGLLIKDLVAKTGGGNYLRIAVRDTKDNDALLSALRAELL